MIEHKEPVGSEGVGFDDADTPPTDKNPDSQKQPPPASRKEIHIGPCITEIGKGPVITEMRGNQPSPVSCEISTTRHGINFEGFIVGPNGPPGMSLIM